ncbi:MAG: FixH family protein [Planctomycetota bacterium]
MHPEQPSHASKTRSGWQWPLAVVAVFSVSLTICGITIYAATSDESHAIEDDYYARAVSWDETAAQRAESAELGWNATASIGAPNQDATRDLTIRLQDPNGLAIQADHVTALVFHHARRGDAKEFTLWPLASGAYRAPIPDARAGIWQVRLLATAGEHHFVQTIDVTTPDGRAQ